jgi:hypothetical protein
MRERLLEPLEEYPGATSPWHVRCMVCGSESFPKWAKVQSRGDGCKECGKKRSADAKRIDPEDAASLVIGLGYEPLEPYVGSKRKWKLRHLKCGREVTPKYENLKIGQGGCVECGKEQSALNRRIDEEDAIERMLKSKLQPIEPYPGRKFPWRCRCLRCGQVTTTTMETVLAGNLGCIPCGRTQRGKKRRLSVDSAIALMRRAGLDPIEDYQGRSKKWHCTCRVCSEETSISLSSVLIRIGKNEASPVQGCEACVFESLGRSRMLSQEQAEERMLALGMIPIGSYRGTFEPWKAICQKCGAENDVQLGKAFFRGKACNACSLRSRTDAARTPEDEAVELMREFGFHPLEPYRGGRYPWRSIHSDCGQEVSPRLAGLKSKKSGCAVCGGRQIVSGYNDLATTHPLLASEMAVDKGYDPRIFGWGMGRKALWRCAEGHEWKSIVGSRVAGTGCPVCANRGFNNSEPAWLYLLFHDQWEMLQVGITNDPETRLATHRRSGWEPRDLRGPMDGPLAQEWESSILRMLRSSGVELTPSGVSDQPERTFNVRRRGEAWWIEEYDVVSLRELMDVVLDGE